jgi:hypothetical protein
LICKPIFVSTVSLTLTCLVQLDDIRVEDTGNSQTKDNESKAKQKVRLTFCIHLSPIYTNSNPQFDRKLKRPRKADADVAMDAQSFKRKIFYFI